MKRTEYMTPAIRIAEAETEEMICSSVVDVNGDAGITMGEGEAPGTADSRRRSVWGDDEE